MAMSSQKAWSLIQPQKSDSASLLSYLQTWEEEVMLFVTSWWWWQCRISPHARLRCYPLQIGGFFMMPCFEEQL